MNRLRNPWVIGGAVAVLLIVGLGASFLFKKKPARKAGAMSQITDFAALDPKKAPVPAARTNAWPDAPIDFDYVQTNLAKWAMEPERDPFQLAETVVQEVAAPVYSPVSQLKLKAIWRQTGGRAAVINDRILTEGETIEGLKVERIESDRVWLKGPERTEPLIFGQVALPPPPPPPPRKTLRGIFGPETSPPPKKPL